MQDNNILHERKVEAGEYGKDWIESAWGEEGNKNLLNKGPIILRPRVMRAVRLCSLYPDIRLLDIACGRGEVPAYVCQQDGHGFGLDYSNDSIEFANKVKVIHESENSGTISLARADATSIPFKNDSFDRVTMLDIIEHLYPEQLEKMFLEVRRILKPDGFAVIHTLPNRWVYDYSYPLARKFYTKISADPRGPYEKKIHINEQDILKLGRLFDRVGLRYRIWHEQLIPAQARWNSGKDNYNDQRDKIYPMLSGIAGRLLEAVSLTPLKLLLCNDIYGVLWKGEAAPETELPHGLTERLFYFLFK